MADRRNFFNRGNITVFLELSEDERIVTLVEYNKLSPEEQDLMVIKSCSCDVTVSLGYYCLSCRKLWCIDCVPEGIKHMNTCDKLLSAVEIRTVRK